MLAEKYSLSASWTRGEYTPGAGTGNESSASLLQFCSLYVSRSNYIVSIVSGVGAVTPSVLTCVSGEDQFQVRGQNGFLLNSTSPLPAVAGDEEIRSTSDHVLETFYPISPTIDLQCAQVYQLQNHTGDFP